MCGQGTHPKVASSQIISNSGSARSTGTAYGGAFSLLSESGYTQTSKVGLVIEDCLFKSNLAAGNYSAHANGGAISYIASRFSDTFHDSNLVSRSLFVENIVASSQEGEIGATNGGGAIFVSLSAQRVPTLSSPVFRIISSNFTSNRAMHGSFHTRTLITHVGGAATVLAAVKMAPSVDAIIIEKSTFFRNGATAHSRDEGGRGASSGGALFLSASSSASTIANSAFDENYSEGYLSSEGGAITSIIDTMRIFNCSFRSNAVRCTSIYVGSVMRSWQDQCTGGHIFSGSTLVLSSCLFFNGSVAAPGSCIPVYGGAIVANWIEAHNTHFVLHSITGSSVAMSLPIPLPTRPLSSDSLAGGQAWGGTISSDGVSLHHSSITDSSVRSSGTQAVGGAIAGANDLTLRNVSVINSSARVCGRLCSSTPKSRFWGISSEVENAAVGGAIGFGSPSLSFENVFIRNSSAEFGGAMALALLNFEEKVANFTVQDSSASVAGGAFFFEGLCTSGAMAPLICNSSQVIIVGNSSFAGKYGPKCATAPWQLAWGRSGTRPTFLASRGRIDVSISLRDYFGARVRPTDGSVSVAVSNSSRFLLISGEPQDKALASSDGSYHFRTLQLAGNGSAESVQLRFATSKQLMCTQQNDVSFNFTLLSCLPSHISLPSSSGGFEDCQECPAGSYYLPQAFDRPERNCVPCFDSEEARGDSWCLRPATDALDSNQGLWTIAAGFYPSPSLEAPTELLQCPTNACLETSCAVRWVKAPPNDLSSEHPVLAVRG